MSNINIALDVELMSLKFFSNRFMIQEKYLKYGIVVKKIRKTEEIELLPAILIDCQKLFINIYKDRLESSVSDSGYKYDSYICEFFQDNKYFIFRYGEYEISICKEDMEDFYMYKVFNSISRRIVGATPEDFMQ